MSPKLAKIAILASVAAQAIGAAAYLLPQR
jgi:hypothetical protein